MKTAILSGNEEIFDYLLEKLSPVDLTTKQFILENAAKTGLPKLIQKIYELWPNDVVFNFDVIKATIESQNIEAIEYLFKNGADINLINDKIFSNMHNYSILFYLIRRGAKFEFSPTNKAFVNLIKNAKVNDLKFCIQKGAKITQEHIEMSQCLLLKKTLQSIPLMTLIFDNNPDLSEKSFLIREITYIALNSGTKYRKLLQRAIDLNAKIDKLSVKNAVQRKSLPILKMFVKNGVRLSGHKLLKFFNTDQDLPSLKELLTDYSQISDYDNFMNDAQVYSADQSIIDYLNEWKESFNTNN
ncbi:hypothetical protein TRFO_26417 [Tritrichomonas foetus]|uniref:DUF3447 domain-containing protein n=1 Tax=Tritrichomonas foetus TaxID=1144522 RepID=A0A1J4K7Q9_9EUKA|nr:hypothetical protein TRFO_26417 [Tritrichomonas foetus]|eukprot:OHT05748.1 hypothetical protein TRFO_26417 [Tritrichomonas foetus]